MTILAGLTHVTRYAYARRVQLGPQIIRLRPAPHCRTSIGSYSLTVEPRDHFLNWQQDPFGNYLARLVFSEKTDLFRVTVDLTARMDAINPFDFFLEESAEHVPFVYDDDLKKELAPYLEVGAATPKLLDFVNSVQQNGQRTIDFLVELNARLEREIAYTIRMEPGVQTPEETLTRAIGSCRDSSWLLVQILRRLGYAARFVSGYLIQLAPDQKSLDGPSGPEADFTDLHAWAEAYAPGAGWIGLDPTSGLFASEGHIPLAATPAPQSAAAITGGVEAVKVDFHFDMKVARIHEEPRVTKPYADAQWAAIDRAGDAIDAQLTAGDVRLTVGGEPTFIAAQDYDADEWNIAAVGPTKRRYADDLIRRLKTRFAPKGLLQFGQGKWYPGEPLPRWAFALYWRADGQPLWDNDGLIAREAEPQPVDAGDASAFVAALARNLGIDPAFATPAYEDPAEFLLREAKLAPDLDPTDNRLEDPMERARLVHVFDRGLTTPASYILPIQAAQARASGHRRFVWESEAWRTRRRALFLIPGDSPAGFRLPLRALSYLASGAEPVIHVLDPFAAHAALPARPPQFQTERRRDAEDDDAPRLARTEEPEIFAMADVVPGGTFVGGAPAVRTALTVEPRDGRLCVFLPPVESADAFVDLVAAIEETAAETGSPVHLEGYPPPEDARMNVIKVTPDPGVIEVNVHPAASWREQVDVTKTLYEEARLARLDTAKFQVDGRPVGSGGGNHIVMGGATPPDSPFLRRPDLLGSLIRYWQNHPSLSYLFSGLFIGPTSQAPRVDEARHDQLYELEIALKQIPDPFAASGDDCPPWLVDRLLRNLLIDATGNTHRAEICIDKLYSPDGPAGRLGLVEFRGFEMPPHAEMSLAQSLLMRALIARFWNHPYTASFRPFGTALHDRFMLPHYVWADFVEVLAETSEATGVTLEPAWYKPHFEFRFPKIGDFQAADLSVELRSALEPWHVLGEEGVVGGTTRFVDSSVERLQVQVTGEVSDRYTVACNGYALPLQPTDRRDARVAGVRFRTWLPASSLHPTIPPHGPLVFDIVDLWNGRSRGGGTYYSEHPGGRNPETRPVNALEAQGRRLARFEAIGHTPGPFDIRRPAPHPAFPATLDLRRA